MLSKVTTALDEGVEGEDAKAMARTRIRALEEESKLLETDLRMLREYIDKNRCIDENGKEHVAVHETAFTDLNCQARPVLPSSDLMKNVQVILETFLCLFSCRRS